MGINTVQTHMSRFSDNNFGREALASPTGQGLENAVTKSILVDNCNACVMNAVIHFPVRKTFGAVRVAGVQDIDIFIYLVCLKFVSESGVYSVG